MSEKLFSEFEPVSSKQWKQQIQFELKGADYNETLVWKSPEGINVKPFYHADEPIETALVHTKASQFKIGQAIFVHDVDKTIARSLDHIARGAECLCFTITDPQTDVKRLLESLPLDKINVHIALSFLSEAFVQQINLSAAQQPGKIMVSLDPIGHLAHDGNWMESSEKDNFEALRKISSVAKNISIVGVNAALYQNAGAEMVQQLAYTLAHANEYFNQLGAQNQPIVISVAVGSNYFFEIAKLRALRLLFETLAQEYNHNSGCHLLVTPSKRNKTLYDYNVNMLRTTTECMSAILGGADTVVNLAYDALYHKDNEFGSRISRNQLLILKNESYFDKVNNPADGSYYIESLTQQLAEKALALFKEIEATGGFIKQLTEGTIQRKIQESAQEEQLAFDQGKEILLGTNKYPNKADRMKDDLELYPFVKIKPRKTLISPIIERRLAEKMEQERLASEA